MSLRLFFAVALFGGYVLCAQNLISNPLMKAGKNGRITSWTVASGKVQSFEKHAAVFPVPGKGFVIFQKIKALPDTDYVLEYEYRSKNGDGCRIYCEEIRKNAEGRSVYRSFSSGRPAAPENWTKIIIPVRLSPGWTSFYVAVRGRKNGTLLFRNLVFKKAPDQPKVMGGHWQVSAPHQLNKAGTAVTVKGKKKPEVGINAIPVRPGREYRIEYTAKGKTASGNTSSSMHVFGLKISPEVPGSILFQDLYPFGTQKKHHTFRIPEKSPVRQVNLTVTFSTPGTVEFSDFRITEKMIDKTADWRIELDPPAVAGVYPGAEAQKITGKIAADPAAVKAELLLNGRKTQLDFQKGTARFSLPAPVKYGKYELTAKIFRSKGAPVVRKQMIRRVPASAHAVTSDGKFLYIGGQRFFPNGLWFGGEKPLDEKQLAYFAANGINSLWCSLWLHRRNSAVLEKMLDTAWKYKIRLLVGCGHPDNMAQTAAFKKMVDKIYSPKVLNHPAFLGIFLADEPLWQGYPSAPLQAAYQIFKDKMPNHAVFTNSAPRYEVEDLRPYSEASDIYGVDIYPIPYPNQHSGLTDKMPSCLGKYARRMREVVRHRKPVIITLQGGSWHEWGSKGKPCYPTAAELRYMALDAITNGATGCKVWGFRNISQLHYTETLMVMFREMHRLAPLFNQSVQQPDLSCKALRIVPFKLGKGTFYVALNPVNEARKTDIVLPGSPREIKFYLDGRTQKTVNGKLSLSLAPYRATVFGADDLPAAAPLPPQPAKNPFAEDCLARYKHLHKEPYTGQANWIWDPQKLTVNGKCRLGITFEVKDPTRPVTLYCAADDAAIVYVNGFEVARFQNWQSMVTLNLRKYLRRGENFLVIEGEDIGALPCGILAELVNDGRKVLSDSSWKTLPATGKVPAKRPADFAGRPSAKVIAPYGAAPWGRQVKREPEAR
ncbi:MAG: hypothetical protein IKC65_00710 [Lentisphaeria bacterium]|nr:hypothetical protein [Lentisphaeria bacterium]